MKLFTPFLLAFLSACLVPATNAAGKRLGAPPESLTKQLRAELVDQSARSSADEATLLWETDSMNSGDGGSAACNSRDNPWCGGVGPGNCCPTDDGTRLACCPDPNSCSGHVKDLNDLEGCLKSKQVPPSIDKCLGMTTFGPWDLKGRDEEALKSYYATHGIGSDQPLDVTTMKPYPYNHKTIWPSELSTNKPFVYLKGSHSIRKFLHAFRNETSDAGSDGVFTEYAKDAGYDGPIKVDKDLRFFFFVNYCTVNEMLSKSNQAKYTAGGPPTFTYFMKYLEDMSDNHKRFGEDVYEAIGEAQQSHNPKKAFAEVNATETMPWLDNHNLTNCMSTFENKGNWSNTGDVRYAMDRCFGASELFANNGEGWYQFEKKEDHHYETPEFLMPNTYTIQQLMENEKRTIVGMYFDCSKIKSPYCETKKAWLPGYP